MVPPRMQVATHPCQTVLYDSCPWWTTDCHSSVGRDWRSIGSWRPSLLSLAIMKVLSRCELISPSSFPYHTHFFPFGISHWFSAAFYSLSPWASPLVTVWYLFSVQRLCSLFQSPTIVIRYFYWKMDLCSSEKFRVNRGSFTLFWSEWSSSLPLTEFLA